MMALCEAKGAEYSAGIITNGYLLTQENADLLERCKVKSAQITLDGVGEAHDKTRHLTGGGATFGCITDNLRQGKLDFSVSIRHNVHAGNIGEVEDKPEHSFGTAGRWDPKNPIATADCPDNLTRYLNTALPNHDAECGDCVWLPACAGGCPNKRLYYQKQCLPFKDEPEKYVLALYDRIGKEKDADERSAVTG